MDAQIMDPPADLAASVDVGNGVGGRGATPSPGLCRLFNAAAMDSGFCAWLLAAPVQAARSVARNAGAAFGCSSGDPILSLPPLPLTDDDLALVRRARGARSLGEAWRRIAVAQAAAGAADL